MLSQLALTGTLRTHFAQIYIKILEEQAAGWLQAFLSSNTLNHLLDNVILVTLIQNGLI